VDERLYTNKANSESGSRLATAETHGILDGWSFPAKLILASGAAFFHESVQQLSLSL
jgi:hypothetical protein